jgi:hypothetical protein
MVGMFDFIPKQPDGVGDAVLFSESELKKHII